MAGGPLAGLQQTVPRSELTEVGVPNAIWSDAKHVVDGVLALRAGTFHWSCDNTDFWQQVSERLSAFKEDELLIRHVPSHLEAGLCECPFEEWICRWNSAVDLQAGLFNSNQ